MGTVFSDAYKSFRGLCTRFVSAGSEVAQTIGENVSGIGKQLDRFAEDVYFRPGKVYTDLVEEVESVGEGFNDVCRSLVVEPSRIGKTVYDVVSHPGVSLAAGSAFLSSAVAPEATMPNALAALWLAGARAHESWTGDIQGRPYLALATLNFYTALKALGTDGDTAEQVAVSVAYSAFGTRSLLMRHQEKNQTVPTNILNSPRAYDGAGFTGMGIISDADPETYALSAASAARAAMFEPPEGEKGQLLFKHATAARLLMGSMAVNMAANWGTSEHASAYALWTWAFYNLDPQANKDFKDDMKTLLSQDRGNDDTHDPKGFS